MTHAYQTAPIKTRREAILQWLDEMAPFAEIDQRHLDADTPERAYWHLGYQAALTDVMDQLFSVSSEQGSEDKSSSSLSDDPDGDDSPAA